jgi:hypothetical protein
VPALVRSDFNDQSGQRFTRSAGGKQHAAIQENPHAFPAFLQNDSASLSSSAIQLRKVSSGISRTGRASAGCRKIPPSLSSTSIIGCAAASKPSFRRCNTALQLSRCHPAVTSSLRLRAGCASIRKKETPVPRSSISTTGASLLLSLSVQSAAGAGR